MSKSQAFLRQMFHITLDIETTLQTASEATLDKHTEQYNQALVQALLAHPEILQQLLRSSAIAALIPARNLLESEYNKGGVSEQDLLKPIMEQLEPEVQAYFTEEIEDHQNVYLFDGSATTIKHFQITASPLQASSHLD